MRKFLPVVVLVLSMVLGATVFRGSVASAAQLIQVFVTNTAADPIPASIVGTPSVSVAGTPTVSIAGTPSVNIASTRQPVEGSTILSSGGTLACATLYTVPAGKRLTIEYVSVFAFGLSVGNSAGVRIDGTQVQTTVNIPMQLGYGGSGTTYVGSEMVQFFTITDVNACVTFALAQGSSEASVEVDWSGHLESAN